MEVLLRHIVNEQMDVWKRLCTALNCTTLHCTVEGQARHCPQELLVNIWDTAGQEEFENLRTWVLHS